MTRNVKIAFIVNKQARKVVQKRRIKGLMKMMEELHTLCGTLGCAIMYPQNEINPEVWPDHAKTDNVVGRYKMVPEVNRFKNMQSQEVHLSNMIYRAKAKVKKQLCVNREKERTKWLCDYLKGEVCEKELGKDELHNVHKMFDQHLEEINERLAELAVNPVQDAINPSMLNRDVA